RSRRPSSRSSALLVLPCILAIVILVLELQTGFTRGFRQRLHPTVIAKTGTIERHLLDASGTGLLGDALANQGSRGDVATASGLGGELLTHLGFQGGSADQYTVAFRSDDVCVNVLIRAENAQPMNALFRDLAARGQRTT